ncbi:MAG: hypothetical protein JSR47_18765 [Proteobacteria bacterium]|nr:hypothetical protein [Pseudomonadota bacterium]MBS0550367.1 hypothetical protein [Pseudomonadota bacterium]
MTARVPSPARRRAIALVVGGLALLVLANVHLVYAALNSHPGCVPHARDKGGDQTYRAAQSAC